MISFNVAPYIGTELEYVRQAVEDDKKISGDGRFTRLCTEWLEDRFEAQKVLLTTSGTTALDMSAVLSNLQPGDEVILPSFTFSSTATAFVSVGARLVFVDIRSDTMNIDERLIEDAITNRTRVIVAVHYAGVACEMDTILEIAKRHGLIVVEDAAQAVMSTYKGKALGTLGTFGCYSFHETKNYSMGEGGALLVNDERYNERAEIIREKGTDRSRFYRGQVDKYTWVDVGDSYLPSEMNAAYLWGQLEMADAINDKRLSIWNSYQSAFADLLTSKEVGLPVVPDGCVHNAHMYYLKCRSLDERTSFISHMKERGIVCAFHYVPLHSSSAGIKFGFFHGSDLNTTDSSERLVRLPLYYGMTDIELSQVIEGVREFFND